MESRQAHALPLTCPQPLPQAVETDIFGYDLEGPSNPCPEQVREITVEHVAEMIGLLRDIDYHERCASVGVHPVTARRPRKREGREDLSAFIEDRLENLRGQYEASSRCVLRGFWSRDDRSARPICPLGTSDA